MTTEALIVGAMVLVVLALGLLWFQLAKIANRLLDTHGRMSSLDIAVEGLRRVEARVEASEQLLRQLAMAIGGLQGQATSLAQAVKGAEEKTADIQISLERAAASEALASEKRANALSEKLLEQLSTHHAESRADAEALRDSVRTNTNQIWESLKGQLSAHQEGVTGTLAALRQDASSHRVEIGNAATELKETVTNALQASTKDLQEAVAKIRESVDGKLTTLSTESRQSIALLNDTATSSSKNLVDSLDTLRTSVEQTLKGELGAIRGENQQQLDKMRSTVDEKLHATLEQRIGESFKQVSERLEQVHKGLGEMASLATGVGDLRRVLTNVKSRGIWGEVQLEAILDQALTNDQFARNICTRPNTNERVEFAIRLPGKTGDAPVWLPVDAKFPLEDYQRLLDAQERADPGAAEDAARSLEQRIRAEAKSIREKYLEPPHTTDFALMYLPTEGLYAEALRRPGLVDALQRDHRVCVVGPTNMLATVNALQMGFRTLAIEKRSSEVWKVLGAVRSEFQKFGAAIAHSKKKLEEASNSLDKVTTRENVLQKRLRAVDDLPEAPQLTVFTPVAALIDVGEGTSDEAAQLPDEGTDEALAATESGS